MRKTILCLIPIIVLFSSCTQKHSVVGDIKGLGNDTLLVSYLNVSKSFQYGKMNRKHKDTIFVKDDKFTYTNIEDEPIIMNIRPLNGIKKLEGGSIAPSSLEMFLLLQPNEKVKIKGHKEKTFIDYSVQGSEISQEFSLLRKRKLPTLIEAAELYMKRDTMRFNKADKAEIEKISKKIKENWDLNKKMNSEYIDNNWDSHLSAYLLWYSGKLYANHERLSDKVRNGVTKPIIDFEVERKQRNVEIDKINKLGAAKEGAKAPDFTLKDINGNPFTLHSAKYEYMVLDFWGSWCVPCIKGFPKMKEYYKRYGDRVEFIGIACKDREDKWKRSVKEHQVNWTQLFNNPKDKNSDVSFLYAVLMYPTKVIIDKEKNIVGVFQGESEEFYNKLDSLLN